jgi:hypothetical protein
LEVRRKDNEDSEYDFIFYENVEGKSESRVSRFMFRGRCGILKVERYQVAREGTPDEL